MNNRHHFLGCLNLVKKSASYLTKANFNKLKRHFPLKKTIIPIQNIVQSNKGTAFSFCSPPSLNVLVELITRQFSIRPVAGQFLPISDSISTSTSISIRLISPLPTNHYQLRTNHFMLRTSIILLPSPKK